MSRAGALVRRAADRRATPAERHEAFEEPVGLLGAIYTHAAHGEAVRLPFNFVLFALSAAALYARRPDFL